MFFCDTLIGNNYNKVKSGIIHSQPLDYWFNDAIFYNNRFWGLHTSNSGYRLFASSDGITYSPQIISTISGRYGCLCPDRTDGGVMCTFVTDETNGRIVCSNGYITRYINDNVYVEQCIFVNGQYYLIGYLNGLAGGGRIYIGSDLSNWQDPIQLSTNSASSIAYGNGIFVVCANDNDDQVFVSYDGLNYTNYATPIGCVKVIFADGYFIGVGYGGVIRSRNGIDWEQIYTENTSFDAVGYGNKKLVVAGDKILTSINFKDFKTVATNISSSYNTITYGKNRFNVTGKNTLYYFDWGIE